MLEISHSSAGAVADEEEYFDYSADLLENICKRMRLNSIFKSLSTDELANSEAEEEQCPVPYYTDSPESSDPSLNLDVFVVEKTVTKNKLRLDHAKFQTIVNTGG